MDILYATKAWRGEWPHALTRHPKAQLIIANNLDVKFVDIGQTDQPYYEPELRAIKEAKKMGAEYILWYASDVIPPEGDWVSEALPLLEKYPIVSPFWEDNYTDYVRMSHQQARGHFVETDWGFEDWFFSDQAYLAKVSTMLKIDYDCHHDIAKYYPRHGGDSFEKRVAQWLASTEQSRAVLKGFKYHHISRENK